MTNDIRPDDLKASLGRVPPAEAADHARIVLESDGAIDDILRNISSSYFRLRRGMAAIALLPPAVLWLGGGIDHLQGSMSAYYHTNMGDVFVGALWALGSFLFFYRGYSTAENRTLNAAGVAAIVVALAPTDWPVGPGTATSVTGYVHGTSAVLFFVLIAYVAIFRAKDTVEALADEQARARFVATYRTLGVAMVGLPLFIVFAHFHFPDYPSWIFLLEAAGVYVFSSFWLVKSREIARIEAQSRPGA